MVGRERRHRSSGVGADQAVRTLLVTEPGGLATHPDIVQLDSPEELGVPHVVPLDLPGEPLGLPPAEGQNRALVRVLTHVEREDVCSQLARLHQGIKKGRDVRLSELRVGEADQRVELGAEDFVVGHHAEGPVVHHELVGLVGGVTKQQLVIDEVALDVPAAERDLHVSPVFLIWAVKSWRIRWIKRLIKSWVLVSLAGQDPRVCTACVENSPDLLGLPRANIKLTNV